MTPPRPEFVVKLDDRELWRSGSLAKRQSEMVARRLAGPRPTDARRRRPRRRARQLGRHQVHGIRPGQTFCRPGRTDRQLVDRLPGPILVDPDYPHSFRYPSGERFFPMGDTAYFLIGRSNDVIAHYIDVRRAHKFNFIRMMAHGGRALAVRRHARRIRTTR